MQQWVLKARAVLNVPTASKYWIVFIRQSSKDIFHAIIIILPRILRLNMKMTSLTQIINIILCINENVHFLFIERKRCDNIYCFLASVLCEVISFPLRTNSIEQMKLGRNLPFAVSAMCLSKLKDGNKIANMNKKKMETNTM